MMAGTVATVCPEAYCKADWGIKMEFQELVDRLGATGSPLVVSGLEEASWFEVLSDN
jgi:hypothetical protein